MTASSSTRRFRSRRSRLGPEKPPPAWRVGELASGGPASSLKRFYEGSLARASFLVGCAPTGEAPSSIQACDAGRRRLCNRIAHAYTGVKPPAPPWRRLASLRYHTRRAAVPPRNRGRSETTRRRRCGSRDEPIPASVPAPPRSISLQNHPCVPAPLGLISTREPPASRPCGTIPRRAAVPRTTRRSRRGPDGSAAVPRHLRHGGRPVRPMSRSSLRPSARRCARRP
jgi:hypothetical protein